VLAREFDDDTEPAQGLASANARDIVGTKLDDVADSEKPGKDIEAGPVTAFEPGALKTTRSHRVDIDDSCPVLSAMMVIVNRNINQTTVDASERLG